MKCTWWWCVKHGGNVFRCQYVHVCLICMEFFIQTINLLGVDWSFNKPGCTAISSLSYVLIGSSFWKSNHCYTMHCSQSHSPSDCGKTKVRGVWPHQTYKKNRERVKKIFFVRIWLELLKLYTVISINLSIKWKTGTSWSLCGCTPLEHVWPFLWGQTKGKVSLLTLWTCCLTALQTKINK